MYHWMYINSHLIIMVLIIDDLKVAPQPQPVIQISIDQPVRRKSCKKKLMCHQKLIIAERSRITYQIPMGIQNVLLDSGYLGISLQIVKTHAVAGLGRVTKPSNGVATELMTWKSPEKSTRINALVADG